MSALQTDDALSRLSALERAFIELKGVVSGIGDVIELKKAKSELEHHNSLLSSQLAQQVALTEQIKKEYQTLELEKTRQSFVPACSGRKWEDICEPTLRSMFPEQLRVTRSEPHSGDFILSIPFWPGQEESCVKILIDAKDRKSFPRDQWEKLEHDMLTQEADFGILLCNGSRVIMDPRKDLSDGRKILLDGAKMIGCSLESFTEALTLLLSRNLPGKRIDADQKIHAKAIQEYMNSANTILDPLIKALPNPKQFESLMREIRTSSRIHTVVSEGFSLRGQKRARSDPAS